MFRLFSRRGSGGRLPVSLGLATTAVLLAWAAPAQSAPFVYVTHVGSDNVSQYRAGAGGLLAPLSPPTVAAGNALKVAVSPDGRSVYVVNNSFAGTISQYTVGPGGALSPKSPARVAARTNPNGVAVSPDGNSVYATFFNSENGQGGVSQYDAGPGGALSPKSPATVASAGLGPTAVAVNPDGKSVYVTNYASFNVSQYNVGADGKLAPKTPATVAAGHTPVGVAVSPNGQSVYVTNIFSNNVSQYDVGSGGALSPKSTATVGTGDGPQAVAVSHNGDSVYVANLYSTNVSQYDVGGGGALSPKSPPTVAARTNPHGVAVTPDSRSVYVTNEGSDNVSQYDVGPGGKLSPKGPATVSAGDAPTGIAITPPAAPGWEGPVTNQASGCSARVQVPYLDGNQQVTAYTKVTCPNATQLTVKSRLRAAYPGFNDQTVAANGCLGGSGCVRTLPKGTMYFRLSCLKSQTRRNNQPYYTHITFYPGTNSNAKSSLRSRNKTLSPFCAN